MYVSITGQDRELACEALVSHMTSEYLVLVTSSAFERAVSRILMQLSAYKYEFVLMSLSFVIDVGSSLNGQAHPASLGMHNVPPPTYPRLLGGLSGQGMVGSLGQAGLSVKSEAEVWSLTVSSCSCYCFWR